MKTLIRSASSSKGPLRLTTFFVSFTAAALFLIAPQGLPPSSASQTALLKQAAQAPAVRPTRSPTTASMQATFDGVKQRLLAVAGSRPGTKVNSYIWPPTIEMEKVYKPNAYATIKWERDKDGKFTPTKDKRTGKFFPLVVVYEGFMTEVIENNPDRLAFILGHELAHLLLGHVLPGSISSKAPTETLMTVFTAEEEHEADLLGMKLALGANYSIKGVREVWTRVNSEEFRKRHPKFNYTSFEGTGLTHPSWTDRLALIDKEKASLWNAMSAFQNGVYFLTFQKYAEAEEAFKRVVDPARGFPDSYDAWANLGYALLMQYFDKLDAKDMMRFDVGQLVVGSFYRRPDTLTPKVRGVDAELWSRAVAAFKKALELNPNSTLAKANLGVSYLLAPTGRNVQEAVRHLEAAAAAAVGDRSLTDEVRAAIYVNASVALLADHEAQPGRLRLEQSLTLLEKALAVRDKETFPALRYNIALSRSKQPSPRMRSEAVPVLANYLVEESVASLWWEPGYRLYERLAREAGQAPKSKAALQAASIAKYSLRPITSVDLGRGVLITLSDPVNTVSQKLGQVPGVPLVEGTNLVRLHYPGQGISILAGRRVVAIFLRGQQAPHLKMQLRGTGSPVWRLRVGMSKLELEKVLGPYYYVVPLTDPRIKYNFYPNVGVAVRYDLNNRVQELAVAQATVE